MAQPPPLALVDDVISEILLRLPPEDPACLVRASLVCKPWCHIVSDGAFLRQYHTFHRTLPVLGFFQDKYCKGTWVPHYIPTIQPSPIPRSIIAIAGRPTASHRIVDCRHGRVLFQSERQRSLTFTVWDPITGNQKCISPPENPYTNNSDFMAAVLCGVDGCDHHGCSMGPFLVLMVGVYYGDDNDDPDGGNVAWARVYSSKTGMWRVLTSIALEWFSYINAVLPSLLVGDTVYFILEDGERILKYSLVSKALSVMSAPPQDDLNMIFAEPQNGELGAATVEGYNLHLWSWQVSDPNRGIGKWARCRVIELEVMIPISIGDPSTVFELVGFAQGAGLIFICANDDIFTVEQKSGQITKIGKRTSDSPIFPFMSFYTPDLVMTARVQGRRRTG